MGPQMWHSIFCTILVHQNSKHKSISLFFSLKRSQNDFMPIQPEVIFMRRTFLLSLTNSFQSPKASPIEEPGTHSIALKLMCIKYALSNSK